MNWFKLINKKAGIYDQPMEDTSNDPQPKLPSGPGIQANNTVEFHKLFNELYLRDPHNAQYYQEFLKNNNLPDGIALSVSDTFKFFKYMDDIPKWASAFCPNHDYEFNSQYGNYVCQTCGDSVSVEDSNEKYTDY